MRNSSLIKIVDSHHKILPAWAAYRNTLTRPPRLITLDYHTDTSPPFKRLIANTHGKNLSKSQFANIQNTHLKSILFNKPLTVKDAVCKLNNDEHIIAAIKSNIISSAFVIAHNALNTNLQTYRDHSIVCHTVNEITSKDKNSKPDHNIVLETTFLEQAIDAFNEILTQAQDSQLFSEAYILDIDLDYFNSFKSISPDNIDKFKILAKNAGIITIATEPEYVKSCAVDNGLNSEYLLDKLLDLLPKVE